MHRYKRQPDLVDLFAVSDANRAQDRIAAGDEGETVLDSGSGMHHPVGLHLPPLFAGLRIDAVEARVIRAEEDHIACDHGRRLDLRSGRKRPQLAPVVDVHGMKEPAEIADVDGAVADARGRLANQVAGRVLPTQLTGGEIECEQIAIAGADIDDSVNDGRGGVDDVLRVVAPDNVERGGRRARGYPGEIGSPAELSPGIGGSRCRG